MKSTRSTCPLFNHVQPCSDAEQNFSPATVTVALNKMHSSSASTKGYVIALFNASHSSDNIICPVTQGRFVWDEKTQYGKYLHLGTTRILDKDGSINEINWLKFVNATAILHQGVLIVPKSKLNAYLSYCYYNDPQDSTTGRNSNALFSSKYIQGTATSAAWTELYDRLTCGWIGNDPHITLALIREFFEDSRKAYKHAEDGLLPIAKPTYVECATPKFPQ
jgi:hypothetical protein